MSERTLVALLRARESVHFDLDGVLLDSNELKVRCMVDAIAGLGPQVVAPFVAEFRVSFGRSRFEHFRRLYAHHLGGDERGWEDFYAIYGGAYGALVRARYGDAPLCAHAASLAVGARRGRRADDGRHRHADGRGRRRCCARTASTARSRRSSAASSTRPCASARRSR